MAEVRIGMTGLAVVMIGALLAAACTGEDQIGDGGPPEQIAVAVALPGTTPGIDTAAFLIAEDRSLFDDEGLVVTVESTGDGADDRAALAAVQRGDADIGFGRYPEVFNVIEDGAELVVVAEATRAGAGYARLYVAADADLESTADLIGRTVGVDRLNDVAQIALAARLTDVGLRLSDLTLVEVPGQHMAAALEAGSVDAVAAVEPHATVIDQTGDAKVVVELFSGRLIDLPVAGWYTTAEFAAANPNTVGAFVRALALASEAAVDDVVARSALADDPTARRLVSEVELPSYVTGLDPDALGRTAQLLTEQGALSGEVSIDDHTIGG
jgi:NitT/TauT family transport system substrate-binding protein